jgi:hypothetical protein
LLRKAGPPERGNNGEKKGIGSYPAEGAGSDASGGETGGKDDVNLDERMGSNMLRKGGKGDLADPEQIQRDPDRYRDEMAEDAPGSGLPDDNS